jgi:hypothetical protein
VVVFEPLTGAVPFGRLTKLGVENFGLLRRGVGTLICGRGMFCGRGMLICGRGMLNCGMLTWPALTAPADANVTVPTMARYAAKWPDMVSTTRGTAQPVNYRTCIDLLVAKACDPRHTENLEQRARPSEMALL